MKYIKRFSTLSGQTEYLANNELDTYVGYVDETHNVYYDDALQSDYSKKYLTFNIVSGGTINWKCNDNSIAKEISYSMDNGENWTTITSTTAGVSFNVDAGDKVLFKGNNTNYARYDDEEESVVGNWFGDSTASFNLYGNIMSLISGDSFTSATSSVANYAFTGMFRNTKVISTENLILPATTLARSCYQEMFYGCTSLTVAPELPATTLAVDCYNAMFNGCTSLTTAPILSATTLASSCYGGMFANCTSLTTAPVLSATTLAGGCYLYMFRNCTSLTTAPELPATTLASNCYYQMFRDCTSLNYIKCLATDISASYCTNQWVNGVASSGTFVMPASMDGGKWVCGENGVPFGWDAYDENDNRLELPCAM